MKYLFTFLMITINAFAYQASCVVKPYGEESKTSFTITVYNREYTEISNNGKEWHLQYAGRWKENYIYSNGWDECTEVFLGKIINQKLSYSSGCEYGGATGYCIIK